RRSPTGGSPNGMPLKLRTPSLGGTVDSRMPLAMLTRSGAKAGCIVGAHTAMRVRIDDQVFMAIIYQSGSYHRGSITCGGSRPQTCSRGTQTTPTDTFGRVHQRGMPNRSITADP